ncbi:conserved hypothetical protein [Desulfitobacterium hafniense DCB-2]|uniref:DnaJ homologue subfamily C member 28 conserved domain-containing protein n=1 Tax=Desulfitobacterium hafniense (strain DSM 10664 / DCB-2) TaxID=272564 RepID=B8FRF2_DESHD|nr:DUF1992 domain-containing protein [Desulfitobacterium hafniense]ACL20067.1 conserved hypothetical protein [Desulfitobacterium hafniense DCB-2]
MFDELVEAKIQEAMKNGEFDNLPYGKPINLNYWASLPEDIRMGLMLLRNAGYVPEEVQLLKDTEELRERLVGSTDPDEKSVLTKKLREAEVKFSMMLEMRRRRR